MANPLKIKTTSGQPNTTNWAGLQTMSASEMDYACHLILTEFASTSTDVGDLNTSATGTAVGTYDDLQMQ